jgi:hypothetical protein
MLCPCETASRSDSPRASTASTRSHRRLVSARDASMAAKGRHRIGMFTLSFTLQPRTALPASPRAQKTPSERGFSATRQERFELPTFGSVDRRSIQLSYWRRPPSLMRAPPARPEPAQGRLRGARDEDRTRTLRGSALASCTPSVSAKPTDPGPSAAACSGAQRSADGSNLLRRKHSDSLDQVSLGNRVRVIGV